MGPELRGYPIDYAQLQRSRREHAIRKTRNGARKPSRRSLALWRKR